TTGHRPPTTDHWPPTTGHRPLPYMQKTEVPGDDSLADRQRYYCRWPQENSERDRRLHAAASQQDQEETNDRATTGREKDRHYCKLPAKKSANHEHHLFVASSHTFTAHGQEVCFADQPQHTAPGKRPKP